MRSEKIVLDSYALIAYMKEEPGWQKVRDVIWGGYKNKYEIFINCVNLGEVYYIVYKEFGAIIADRSLSFIKMWPINLVEVNEELAIVAGRVKAENRISYADAYTTATALVKRATVLTGDKEFREVESFINVEWLPRNK